MSNMVPQAPPTELIGCVTACVITRNEEKSIERALKSLQWADEIVVIDAISNDQTVEIAKKYTIK